MTLLRFPPRDLRDDRVYEDRPVSLDELEGQKITGTSVSWTPESGQIAQVEFEGGRVVMLSLSGIFAAVEIVRK